MRFAGGGESLCVTHRCASLPASPCRCSLPLAPLLSSSVANGIDKKKRPAVSPLTQDAVLPPASWRVPSKCHLHESFVRFSRGQLFGAGVPRERATSAATLQQDCQRFR